MSWNLLIVEDDEAIAESLAAILVARGYHVATAPNGKAALELVRTSGVRPDAVLLDLLMPVMSGFDFLREREHESLLASVPIIVITAQLSAAQSLSDTDRVFARILKPLPLATLLDTVYRAVHGGPPGGATGRSARRAA